MFGIIQACRILVNSDIGKRVNYELKKEFSQDSPVTHKECKHRLMQRFPKGLYCCINCRRTFQVNLFMSEIKLNKMQFAELIALMPDVFEGSK